MIKKIDKKIFATILSFILLVLPMALYAKGLITCGAVDGSEPECNFNELLNTANKIIEFLLIYFATPLAAIIFSYAGFLYLFSGGNETNVTKAKTMMKNMLIGYVIALAAWIIVKTIMASLNYNGPQYLG